MTTDIHCFVFDGLSDWETGYALAGINTPAFQREPGAFRTRILAKEQREVTTAGGLRVTPDLAFAGFDPAQCRMLIIPGGIPWDQGKNMEAVDLARQVLEAGGTVAAICGATLGLAKGGLLDTVRHTSNARQYLAASGYKGANLYTDEKATTDGQVITAGAVWPIDFAYHIFRKLGVFTPQVLDDWYGLFTTNDMKYFQRLSEAA